MPTAERPGYAELRFHRLGTDPAKDPVVRERTGDPKTFVYAASGVWILAVPGLEPDYFRHWLPALLMSGIGVGMTFPSLAAAVGRHDDPRAAAAARNDVQAVHVGLEGRGNFNTAVGLLVIFKDRHKRPPHRQTTICW